MDTQQNQNSEFSKAKLNPAAHFSTPEDVLRHPFFTPQQKMEILQLWQYDASELEVAEEEGMTGISALLKLW